MTDKGLKRIVKYKELYDLTSEQTLYMVLKYYNISYSLPPRGTIELMDLKILNEEGDFIENLATISKVSAKELIINKPFFETEFSKEIYSYLTRRICYKNPMNNKAIAKNPESFKKNKEKRLSEYTETCLKLVKGENNFLGVYNTFLALFPTMAPETYGNPDNSKWVTFFGVVYTGMNLRKRTVTNTNLFMRNLKKKDSGIFLYSLYLFIRNGIIGKETFIGSQKTFFNELDVWYEQAEVKIDEVDNVEDLFKGKRASNKGTKGGVTL